MNKSSLLGIFTLIILLGCTVGPVYSPPSMEVPNEWKTTIATPSAVYTMENWWEVFEDETLNELESQAIANNPSLTVAMERVLEARALAGVKRADLFPHASLDPLYSSNITLVKFPAPSLSGAASALAKIIFRLQTIQNNLPINLSYEVDLWGKIRGQYDSALWTVDAQENAYHVALLSLTTDLASSYYRLRTFDKQLDFFNEIIQTLQQTYTVVSEQYHKGIANNIDLSNASLQLANTQSTYEDTLRQREIEENAIATLMGIPLPTLPFLLFRLGESLRLFRQEFPPPFSFNVQISPKRKAT